MNAPLPSAAERRIDLRETPEQKADRRRFLAQPERITAMGDLGGFDHAAPATSITGSLDTAAPAALHHSEAA